MARHDVHVYNEATGWTITSKGLAGWDLSALDGSDAEWAVAVADGVFVPLELVQDDPIDVRVVADEPLTPVEEEEWVGHFSSRLQVPDGVLTLTGGIEYLWGEEMDEYTQHVPVAPGNYRLDVYTYMPWLNGDSCLKEASREPWGAYHRRTRPGQPFPAWLQRECLDEPEIDPGHQNEWPAGGQVTGDEEATYITFLLHLQRVENWEGVPSVPLDEKGWVDFTSGARQPARCPQGLVSTAHGDPEEED